MSSSRVFVPALVLCLSVAGSPACSDAGSPGAHDAALAPDRGSGEARLDADRREGGLPDAPVELGAFEAGPGDSGADSGMTLKPPFGAAVGGAYLIGSSFAAGVRGYVQTFTQEAGLSVSVTEWITGGASMWTIWNGSGTARQARLAELTSGKYGALFMNAQRPWRQTGSEAIAAGNFASRAHAADPSFRVVIQQYWTFEQSPYRFADASTRAEDLAMYRQGALRVAMLMALAVGTPVYVAPVGAAVEAVKELAAGGKLAGFAARADLHEADGQHLSALGLYVQALTLHGALYQDRPHGHSAVVGSGSAATTLSAGDAKLIWDAVHTALRDTPFSGWYRKAPATLSSYKAAMSKALRNWETFDALAAQTVTSGTFAGQDGATWSFTKGRAQAGAPRLVNNTLYLESGGTVTAPLAAGVGDLSFILSPPGPGTASVMVKASARSIGPLTRAGDNTGDLLATVVKAVAQKGPVKLTITCTKGPCLVDNVQWTDP